MIAWMFRDNGTRSDQTAESRGKRSGQTALPVAPQLVEVSFVTDPFEAKIYVDGQLLSKPQRSPTPRPARSSVRPARAA